MKPEIGMGVTCVMWTDSVVFTITRVSPSGKTFWATLDKVDPKGNFVPKFSPGGFCGHVLNNNEQEYVYTPQPDGQEHQFRLSKNGKWKRNSFRAVILGQKSFFYDYNF